MKRVAMCGGADPHSLRCARFSKPAPEPSGFTHHMASKPSQEIVDGSDLDRRTDEQTRRQNLPTEIFQRIFIMIRPCQQNMGSVYLARNDGENTESLVIFADAECTETSEKIVERLRIRRGFNVDAEALVQHAVVQLLSGQNLHLLHNCNTTARRPIRTRHPAEPLRIVE